MLQKLVVIAQCTSAWIEIRSLFRKVQSLALYFIMLKQIATLVCLVLQALPRRRSTAWCVRNKKLKLSLEKLLDRVIVDHCVIRTNDLIL